MRKSYSLIIREELTAEVNDKKLRFTRTQLLLKNKPYRDLEAYVMEHKVPFCKTQVIRGNQNESF
jgi:hypothetical protein